MATPTISVKDVEAIKNIATEQDDEIRIIRLENGGIRITTRAEANNTEATNPTEEKENE